MSDPTLAVFLGGLVLFGGLALAKDLESKGLAALVVILGALLAGGGLRAASSHD
jgi:hypothetical protein